MTSGWPISCTPLRQLGPSIPYTHEQIAAITGMSRVSVTRILKQFRRPASSASLTAGSRFWPPSGCLRSLPPWDIFWTEPLSESAKNFSEKGLAFLAHWR
ncbi:MAG: helix-turn-helix domain-containing protein [Dysosmobacter welbionis]